jgi:hypothetical protein
VKLTLTDLSGELICIDRVLQEEINAEIINRQVTTGELYFIYLKFWFLNGINSYYSPGYPVDCFIFWFRSSSNCGMG